MTSIAASDNWPSLSLMKSIHTKPRHLIPKWNNTQSIDRSKIAGPQRSFHKCLRSAYWNYVSLEKFFWQHMIQENIRMFPKAYPNWYKPINGCILKFGTNCSRFNGNSKLEIINKATWRYVNIIESTNLQLKKNCHIFLNKWTSVNMKNVSAIFVKRRF